VTLTTATLQLDFSLKWGNLTYRDSQHVVLLREGNAVPRTYESAEVNGEKTYHVTDRFSPDAIEAFLRPGPAPERHVQLRGSTVELGQNNTDVAIPLLVSSKGYAILWNSASLTYADNRFPLEFHFTSLAGDAVDYYFLYGPEMDQIIHHYRTMTGHAPLFPKWATASSNPKIATSLRTKFSVLRTSTAPAHPPGCDRSGLVLVEDGRGSRIQLQLLGHPWRTEDAA